MSQPRVFIAILDWGLGHATRSIPIIRQLEEKGGQIVLGSAGHALELLRLEFPHLECIELPAYNIHYRSSSMWWNMAWQWPKIAKAVWQEHRELQKVISPRQIDFVISDSRFGCFSKRVPCVFVSHQLYIQIPFPPLRWMVNQLNHLAIRQFSECWVPDLAQASNLAGALAHPPLDKDTHYIGLLSRMKPQQKQQTIPVVAVLSGPEPQRTYLEQKLIQQATEQKQHLTIVQGKPPPQEPIQLNQYISLIPFLSADALNTLLCQSQLVICRSGYTSLMDLAVLGKQALLIPTPGQTEQEYLADKLEKEGICHYQTQAKLDLVKDLAVAKKYRGFEQLEMRLNLLERRIETFFEKQ